MKYLLSIILALSFVNVNAARITPTQFVELASKQSMLSQKIAKSYMLLANESTDNENLALELKIAISYFNRNLETLKSYAVGNDKLSSAIEVQELTWKEFVVALKKEKTPNSLVKVFMVSEKLLKTSNYVLAIGSKDYIKSKSLEVQVAQLVNISCKQSALSERLSLLFINQKLQDQFDKNDRIDNTSLKQTFLQIDESIGFLISSSFNMRAKTDLVVGKLSIEFDKLKENKDDFFDAKLELKNVIDITNTLTKLFNELNYAYIHTK